MKRKILYAGFVALISIGLFGCYKDVILPESAVDPDGPPMAVSYNADIKPMLNTKCALAGCHVSAAHKPYLNADISYNQLVNGGFINTILPKESVLYKKINSDMKEYIPSAADRQKVYDWIRTGAQNN
ncbi:hypothetical protein CAP36_08485 [Chitinophagaceae bacterium IBVUCB2]|nr:hypothetical protein CAP36_08485 [Chitinophagaceae bacterium IBVUCB2]